MPAITVVAKIKVKADAIDKVRSEMLKLVQATKENDAGCLNYDLHQENGDPSVFFFLENWESQEQLNQHLETEHMRSYLEATKGLIEERHLHLMTRLS